MLQIIAPNWTVHTSATVVTCAHVMRREVSQRRERREVSDRERREVY